MKLNYIATAIAALGGFAVAPTSAAVFTETVDLASQSLNSGDEVYTQYSTGVVAEAGTTNSIALGDGSINVTLEPTANSGWLTGIKLSNGQTHDLGTHSSINISKPTYQHTVRGIGLGNSSHILAEGLQINIDAPVSIVTGIHGSSGSQLSLGSDSVINIKASSGTGIHVASGSSLTADKATIALSSTRQDSELSGIVAEDHAQIRLGNDSKILLDKAISSYGIELKGINTVLTANALTLEGGNGIYVANGSANIDLGHNSQITSHNNAAIILANESAQPSLTTFRADHLTIINHSDRSDSAFDLRSGMHQVDLGVGSKIYATGDNSIGISIDSDQGTSLKAKQLLIEASGYGAVAAGVYSGRLDIEDNSLIKSGQGSGIAAYTIDEDNGAATINVKDSTIESKLINAVAQGKTARIHLVGSLLKVRDPEEIAVGLWAIEGGMINVSDSQIQVEAAALGSGKAKPKAAIEIPYGTFGIKAESGGKVNLSNHNAILVDGIAFHASGADTLIDAQGQLIIEGDVITDKQGSIMIKADADSYFKGGFNQNSDGHINFSSQKSNWDLTQDSRLDHLDLDQSKINFVGDENGKAFNKLTVAKLSGSGAFAMRAGMVEGESDFLTVTESSSGEHQVSVANRGSANTDGSEVVTIINTPDGHAIFDLTNNVELGGYVYGLNRDDNGKDWSLVAIPPEPGIEPNPEPGQKPKPPITTTADAAANSMVASYLANFVENQSLIKRMGELRDSGEQSNAWARVYGGKIDSFGSGLLNGFDLDYKGIQFGVDRRLSIDNGARLYMGMALGILDTDQDYKLMVSSKQHGKGSGGLKSYSTAIYGTYVTDQNFYTDVMVKYARMKNKFDVLDTALEKVTGSAYTTGLSLSGEVGKRFNLDTAHGQWHVTPQAQLTLSTIEGMIIKASNGLTISVDDQDSVLGRAGVELGYDFKQGASLTTLYAKTSYVKEFSGSTQYVLNTSQEPHSFKGHWWQFGLGVNTQIKQQHNVYFDLESNQGNRFDQRQVNLGYRYTF